MKEFIWAEVSDAQKDNLLERPSAQQDEGIVAVVLGIIADVQDRGDTAVRKYTSKFDGVDFEDFKVSQNDIDGAQDCISNEARIAIETAYDNIFAFHEKQGFVGFDVEIAEGVSCSRIVRPIETVGLYVPGGSAPLISTTLMNGIPSKIAGCLRRIMCTPCDKDGGVNPHILYAAKLCGITEIYKVGGAQAIAAMAYGTDSIPAVDKIFGPGNAYVTAAKKIVALDPKGAALDVMAGPSEICIIADETTVASFAASELVAQAEHDPMSQVILVTLSQEKGRAILDEVEQQMKGLPREDIARQALQYSAVIVAQDMDEAMEIANLYAAEHLTLCFDDAEQYVDQTKHAGSVFLGQYASVSAGDYCSGTSHVLPTNGYARAYSGLTVEAFQKTVTLQAVSRAGLEILAPTIQTLANLEGLDAHANTVSVRLKS